MSATVTPSRRRRSRTRLAGAPRLTQARGELLREIRILDEYGAQRTILIPAERPLTVFVDKRELVTLMTLGAAPELLVLGYLRNQRLVESRRRDRRRSPSTGTSAPRPCRRVAGMADLEARPRTASSPPAAARARCSAT